MRYLMAAALLFYAFSALAVECPPETPDCKVIYLSPQEVQVLIQQNGALDTAEWGNRKAFEGIAAYFRTKIGNAQAGEKPKLPAEKP